jgi:hypothetical protein
MITITKIILNLEDFHLVDLTRIFYLIEDDFFVWLQVVASTGWVTYNYMIFLKFYLRILFDLPADLSKLFPAEITCGFTLGYNYLQRY